MSFKQISFNVCMAVVSAFILAGCGGGGGGFSKEITPVAQTGTVAGKLATPAVARLQANATTLVPLVDAVVSCGERQSVTGSDGSFRITLVPTGVNRCTAVKTGYNLIEFTVDVMAKAVTNISSDIPVYKEGEFLITVDPKKTSGTTSDTYEVACDVVGGRAETIEIRCDPAMTYTTNGAKANHAFRICSYTSPGSYAPSCKVNSSVSAVSPTAITVTGATTVSVDATVNPTSGTVNDIYQLTCIPSGTPPSVLEGRCSSSSSWSAITGGYTMNCSYPNAGTYTPECRVDKTVSDAASAVTVSLAPLSVTASVTPTIGLVVDKYVVTCLANGTPASIEAKCDLADSSWSNLTIEGRTGTKECTYANTGTYTPTCRVNSLYTDDVDTSVTVTKPKVLSFSPVDGATNVLNNQTVFSVTFDYTMDNSVNFNLPANLTASGFSITIQNANTGTQLIINTTNALSYGSFAWTKKTLDNDTLKFTLKSNSTLISRGLEPIAANQLYNITQRTVPTNLKESRGVPIDTTTNIPSTGSFTTKP